MDRLTQVVNVLSNWGYISVIRIKTQPVPCLKITVKRSTDFQEKFDEFAATLQVKREERDRLKAEKEAEAEAAAAKGDASNDKEEVAQPAAAASEDQEESPSAALSEAATDALTEV